MDGSHFDTLVKALATTRVSRLTALRGLAVGAVAGLTGLSRFSEEAETAKNKPRKRRVCLCSAAGCQSKKVRNPKKVIKRNAPCAYRGGCTTNPCARRCRLMDSARIRASASAARPAWVASAWTAPRAVSAMLLRSVSTGAANRPRRRSTAPSAGAWAPTRA